MNKESTQNVTECSTTDTNSRKRMAMTKGGDAERTLDTREEDKNEASYADERKNRFGGGCGEEESESNGEEVLGGEREKFGCGNVKEIKETNSGEEYNVLEGGVNLEVKDEKGGKDRIGSETKVGEKSEETKGHDNYMTEGGSIVENYGKEEVIKGQSERNQVLDNVPANDIRSHEGADNDDNNQNEIETRSEMIYLEEGSAPMQMEEPELFEDVVTPALKLVIFNITLPCIDFYFDARLIPRLQPQYLGCLLVVVSGLLLHFIFTCFAWWRLEPRAQKKWSWIFLILQIWPQMKAVEVGQNRIISDL